MALVACGGGAGGGDLWGDQLGRGYNVQEKSEPACESVAVVATKGDVTE